MKTRTGLAAAMGATSALALLSAAPADAHTASGTTPVVLGPRISHAALIASLLESPLDRLATWAATLQAKVAAIPDDTVLTGRSRLMAKRQLAAARRTNAFLSTVTGLTAAQQARVDAVQARLTAAAAGLKALLANTPPVTAPVTLVRTSTDAVKVADLDGSRDGRCDGHWDGSWDGSGSRYDGSRYDGWSRDGYRHHRSFGG